MIWRMTRDRAQRLTAIGAMLGAVFSTLGCYLTALPTTDPPVVLTGTASAKAQPAIPTTVPLATQTMAPWSTPTVRLSSTPTTKPSNTPTAKPSLAAEKTALPQETATEDVVSEEVTPEGGVEAHGYALEVFRLINAIRAERSLPPLTYSEQLARVAQLHAEDCLERTSLTHTGSDGSTVQERILRSGYDAVGWAEVIVYSASPQEAVEWWMDEVPPNDPHRRTLLGSWQTEIGIAVVSLGNGYYYFVADLARPASP